MNGETQNDDTQNYVELSVLTSIHVNSRLSERKQ